MDLAELQNIDFQNLADWPIPVKIGAILILCVAALFGGYWYDTQVQIEQLNALKAQVEQKKTEFKDKQEQANILEQLKRQLAEIEVTFGELLKRLPKQTEVGALLQEISQAGLASGLSFELFQPQPERTGEGGVYKELPISLRMKGNYHAFGKFISDVAALPRIVTQHDISIKPVSPQSNELILTTVAKTYRYIDETEEAELEESNKAKLPKK